MTTPITGGAEFQFTGPSSPITVSIQFYDINKPLAVLEADPGEHFLTSFGANINTASMYAGDGRPTWIPICGKIVNGANTGNVQLQWRSPDSSGYTLKIGTWLIANKI
jgi:hypothetical protein